MTWTIRRLMDEENFFRHEEGFAIYDDAGEIRGKFASPQIMATHLAMILEENDKMRQCLGKNLHDLQEVAWMVLTPEQEKVYEGFLRKMRLDGAKP